MEIFDVIVGACSILSFVISLFVANKVIKISNDISIEKNDRSPKIKGDGNITSGRDTSVNR